MTGIIKDEATNEEYHRVVMPLPVISWEEVVFVVHAPTKKDFLSRYRHCVSEGFETDFLAEQRIDQIEEVIEAVAFPGAVLEPQVYDCLREEKVTVDMLQPNEMVLAA